jgi:lincosamide and streptogramin A transport system ATP-binding/permease protein
MAQINVSNLTFRYEGSSDNIFEDVSFRIDTDWKLGFIGRNGKGKTTFLNLLLGKHEYLGNIHASTVFDYFPYEMTREQMNHCSADMIEERMPDIELWKVICELEGLQLDAEILYRPFHTLSQGEQTKVMLSMLFARDNYFLLIDEPTNHLDTMSRNVVKEYLRSKKGYILVSHDRDLLDSCVDHVLILNRNSINIEKGNFTSWWENKEKRDLFEKTENEKHLQEIAKLKKASLQTSLWANKNESTKIGTNPTKEHDRKINARSYIGSKTKKMESRRKQIEQRMVREILQKEELLKDIEKSIDLKVKTLTHHKEVYVRAQEYHLSYIENNQKCDVLKAFNMEIHRGERILLQGANGCGKSSFIQAVLRAGQYHKDRNDDDRNMKEVGILDVASGLIISYINQDTSFLRGSLSKYLDENNLEESLIKAILRQLDFDRVQFEKNIEEYSMGQKKKLLLASSLMRQAHLYIWDEPFNHIDIFSRIQIENLIMNYQPTMLLVEHDPLFGEKVATRVVNM